MTIGTAPSHPLATAQHPLADAAVSTSRRRALQLVLAGFWLLDGVLQLQPAMFTKTFAQTVLHPTVSGNPGVVATPMSWAHQIVLSHPVGTNTAFACIQLTLGAAIAFRPTVRLGLAASIPWAIAVWWFGEGLGGVLSGSADPLTGAPGAVIIYALLAVLLWPADENTAAPFEAAGHVGGNVARALWLTLWASLVYFTFTAHHDAAGALRNQITAMKDGQPAWLASIMSRAANLTDGRELTISIVLGVLLTGIAVSVYLSSVQARRVWLVVALIFAALIWVVVEAFGGVFTGMATDPNSGPLLALFALCYWPRLSGPEGGT